MATDQRCEACGSMLAEDGGDCPVCAAYGPPAVPLTPLPVPHTCPRCHVVKAEGAPCRVCWTPPPSDMLADVTAACERALEASARGPQPGVITEWEAKMLRKLSERAAR